MFENLNWVPIYGYYSRKWRNEYWRCGELVKIEIFNAKDVSKKYIAYIDYADFDTVRKHLLLPIHDKRRPAYMVYLDIHPRVGKCRKLHRLLMNPPDDMVVDHINRNPLDNRRINLRVCTVAENNRNLSIRKNNTSGIMGVYYRKNRGYWVAQKYYKGKWTVKGGFKTKEEAAEYRKYLEEIQKD